MGHYAKVDQGLVIDVIVADKEFIDNFVDTTPGEWIKTSYNTFGGVHYQIESTEYGERHGAPSEDQSKAFRKNYAIKGGTYDIVRDAFIPPKPSYESWVLNEEKCIWEAPVENENSDGSNTHWIWNEELLTWDQI